MTKIKERYNWLKANRFGVFLLSFVLMIVGDVFFDESLRDYGDLFLILQNFFFSYILFLGKARWMRIVNGLIILSAVGSVVSSLVTGVAFSGFFSSVYLAYFIMITIRIISAFRTHELSGTEMIMAAFSGFILMAVLGALLFMTLGNDGFTGQIGEGAFSDFLYFSFVTILTIGYGEIVPSSEEARKLVILLGLAGNFFTVFVVAIIVSKFISEPKDND